MRFGAQGGFEGRIRISAERRIGLQVTEGAGGDRGEHDRGQADTEDQQQRDSEAEHQRVPDQHGGRAQDRPVQGAQAQQQRTAELSTQAFHIQRSHHEEDVGGDDPEHGQGPEVRGPQVPVAEADQVHEDDGAGGQQDRADQHRMPAQLTGLPEEGPRRRWGLAVAEPAVEVLGQGVAGGPDAQHSEPEHGDHRPQDVQPGHAPEPGQPPVQGHELLEAEHQYTPSSPSRLAREFTPTTRISPTRPLNRPTAVAKLSWPFWMPAVYTKVSKISPTSRFIEFSSRNMCSKPSSRKSPMDRMNSTMMVGRMAGNVMCQVCFQRFAPSISAASYSDMSTAVSAAR